mmetsp:Transcript_35519/g.58582  ORF Transcript_35519/g.58582 Transcript_35519/m.58582 type:complete len:81 (+) Transcript_35519:123-365(+)
MKGGNNQPVREVTFQLVINWVQLLLLLQFPPSTRTPSPPSSISTIYSHSILRFGGVVVVCLHIIIMSSLAFCLLLSQSRR